MPINTATPSCSTPCNSSNTCITNNRTAVPITVNHNGSNFDLAFNTPVQFASESSLQEHELLLYSIMTLAFPTSPFSKNYTPCKYDPIVNVMFQITGVKFSNQGIRNYFHRVNTNKVKGIGKTNGVCRWIYYQKNIESFLQSNKHLLTLALQGEQLAEETINHVTQQLKTHCTPLAPTSLITHLENEFNINHVNQEFEKYIKPTLTCVWSRWFKENQNSLHFYQYGDCPGYAEKEVELTADGNWSIFLEGKLCNLDPDCLDVPITVRTCRDLKQLLDTIGSMKICQGYHFDKYKTIFPSHNTDSNEPLFKTKDGTPGAVVDTILSKNKEKIVRSSKCILLLWQDDTLKTPDVCEACKSTNHYLRTVLSRANNKRNTMEKVVRYDYMSKEELLTAARNAVKEMRYWKQKCQRLEEYRSEMTTVGLKTNNDLQAMFKQMYNGVSGIKAALHNPICKWQGCDQKFENVELLYEHSKQHITRIDTVATAPIHREYQCLWEECGKKFKKCKLLQNHLREHTGFAKDELMEILLKDQAKSLSTPAKQMRWHPLVIQWCLKMYCKSHSIYEGMRSSGALRLPSGRTLSDYKNFNSPQSGWHSETIQHMKNKYDKMKGPKHGKLGGLFFDEVKIKEGLVFDSSSWELIGFTDIFEEKDQQSKPLENLATHVLQFFYRSMFFKFDFPCAYFLTKGATAVQLNRMFWLGVSLLHSYGFEIILTCCDGASTNRTFYTMNTNNDAHSEGYNPFSNLPIFFMSDPPHLMKKLRNNLFNSGFKEKNRRFSRSMANNGKYILWEHITDVYNREKMRSLNVTDVRSSHVNLDNLSKMRVKLAVQTLSSKVADEMEMSDKETTSATQEYISMCDNFWKIFNSSNGLKQSNQEEISSLNNVAKYFRDWKESLAKIYKKKSEQASHFISWQTMFDLMGTIDALKRLLKFMASEDFHKKYGELFVIPGKLNQDFVESFFSCQRQMCGGTQNMTAYVYAYNINGYSCFQTAKALGKRQTNVYELEETMAYFDGNCELPRRQNKNSVYDLVEWYIDI